MANPEYEITHAVIRYALRCMRDSNWHALREMGFGCKECEALNKLALADLAALETRIQGHVLKIELNQRLFWAALDEVKREATELQDRIDLIKRDAPADMMLSLYGIGDKEYARLRRRHGIPTGVGRPLELDPDTVHTLSEILTRYQRTPTPADWLVVAEESGLGLRAIWREYRRWRAFLPGKSYRDRGKMSGLADRDCSW